ncbi:DUF87 domain-containing protein [Paenibacillus sp. J5C_2022]|uniref:ATP-binding protein n=1 Tax=Paenibacillus sp. J5C2022 TaxID=2977129 RepID=UPI0021CE8686|nr:DUF87 domain-containing protein [Paenibacillus sp. J5C2022]MCU6710552.1 DUF87 domain-containing protein [Paenibacillus sp. J5C2022]
MREQPSLFHIHDEWRIGSVYLVDSYRVNVSAVSNELLGKAQVNGYVLLHTSDPNARLIGRVDRIVKAPVHADELQDAAAALYGGGLAHNDVTISVIGTVRGAGGGRERPVFTGGVDRLPEIGAACYLLQGEHFALFVNLLADGAAMQAAPLTLGSYAQAAGAPAILDGNAFFHRHAAIVGSTGSGKSWTVARIVEQAAELRQASLILFDLHGEYGPLAAHPNIGRYRIAGPSDLTRKSPDALFLPYWLLGYEDMLALILDRSDENAPNQAMAFSRAVIAAKQAALREADMQEELASFTIDSPVPYPLDDVVKELTARNEERNVNPRTGNETNGPLHGRFNRFLPRLSAKRSDRRYGFLFPPQKQQLEPDYLDLLAETLMGRGGEHSPGVKIIDFSEVPSDILPLAVSLIARLVFQIQQWSGRQSRHPVALVCEEAHLYMPQRSSADAAEARAVHVFERIAKEGRKYGVSLLPVSQRPSEINTTIMSQMHHIVAMRLIHHADKSAVSLLLPEHLGGIDQVLPALGVGEAVVAGASCLLPGRIKVREPECKPASNSMKVWEEWQGNRNPQQLRDAVRHWRRQSRG